jgi:hypothetical protein
MKKIRNVEHYFRNGGRGKKRRMMEGVNSNIIYLIYYKNFCKCHNVPPPSTTKILKIKKPNLQKKKKTYCKMDFSNFR